MLGKSLIEDQAKKILSKISSKVTTSGSLVSFTTTVLGTSTPPAEFDLTDPVEEILRRHKLID